jgi:hypothetical protein
MLLYPSYSGLFDRVRVRSTDLSNAEPREHACEVLATLLFPRDDGPTVGDSPGADAGAWKV